MSLMPALRPFALAFTLALAALVSGCALLKPGGDQEQAEARGEPPAEGPPRYDIEVEAPGGLRALVADNLDLQRFRTVPAEQGLTEAELERLVAAAPQQAKALLRTEGYFNATVEASLTPAQGDRLPRVVIRVEPGPRTLIDSVAVDVHGELRRRAESGDAQAAKLRDRVREQWALKPGEPFRQDDWTGAKNTALAQLQANGYPAADWRETQARVRQAEQRASLVAQADSGPLFRLGEIRIEGVQRYGEESIRNLADFAPGTPYSQQQLLEYQDRLRLSGLYEGAAVTIGTDPAQAEATPVTVRVREQRLQNATLGLGYSSDTGPRFTLEHMHRQPFGLHWTARNNLEVGNQRKLWEFDLRSYARPRLWHDLVAGNVERWTGEDEDRTSARLRVGRTQDRNRLERTYYAELQHSRVDSPLGRREAQSLTGNADWTWRHVDSRLLPTRGQAVILQTALGYARGNQEDSGPFGRLYTRMLYFRPFGDGWQSRLRLDVGQVFARESVGVPDPLLFRAGGEESVRGYAYRSLGPVVNGVVTSGRSLLTASAEVAHPITRRFPALLGAVFIDAGNAAERFSELDPVVGVGVGLHYRSPVGPLRVDLAYGVEEQRFRLHVTAGVSF
ncbi:autotransporter assembly complex protein TamA [Azohydromonas caseinilytica]|uniref:BamA/TamA family outer membrane protein n=1 Tax=Azohydromonas caseinilytica TaxID=2728836 RepID=A0A848FGI3_9BURK|nr:BamA/TamA family outer membrane protein [Azohydromonas caseinilytica]NML17270.1 BamA/TamA family outer membrane protein [Azohydromonas caseinilytica]